MINDNDSEEIEDFNLPTLSENPTSEEIQNHMAIIEERAREELGVDLSMATLFMELAQRGGEPSLMDITDLIAKKIAEAKADKVKLPPTEEEAIPENGQYIIKISVTHLPDIYRTIAFNGGHSLSHVHLAIQNAFEFDNEHFYAFYLDNKVRHSKKFFNDPRTGEGPFANEHTLVEIGLRPRQRILYRFDFDDSWEFHIDLLEIATDNPTSPYPIVLEEHGDAPMQYGREISNEDEEDEEW